MFNNQLFNLSDENFATALNYISKINSEFEQDDSYSQYIIKNTLSIILNVHSVRSFWSFLCGNLILPLDRHYGFLLVLLQLHFTTRQKYIFPLLLYFIYQQIYYSSFIIETVTKRLATFFSNSLFLETLYLINNLCIVFVLR